MSANSVKNPFDFTDIFDWDDKTKDAKAEELAASFTAPNLPSMASAPATGAIGAAGADSATAGAGGFSSLPPGVQATLFQSLLGMMQPQQPQQAQLPPVTGGVPMQPPDFFSGLARSK